MSNEPTEERLRSLECDRLMAAGLFMGAATIAATRFATKIPAAAGLFAPTGAGPILAPLVTLGALMIGAIALIIASGIKRRLFAGMIVATGAAFVALAAPFLFQSMTLFTASASPPLAAAVVAFVAFGLNSSIAIQETKPASRHAAMSAMLTIFVLVQAAADSSGVFSTILAVMSMLFFTLWRAPEKN